MATKKSGGAKTARTETVTVRLDPELRYLAEIASRVQRRTLSSYVEWAIRQSLEHVEVSDDADDSRTIADMSKYIWDVDIADRFVKLAFHAPHLLNYDGQVLWKLVRENGWLWRGWVDQSTGEWVWTIHENNFLFKRFREKWELFSAVATGDADPDTLPDWGQNPFSPNSDIPEEPIPF